MITTRPSASGWAVAPRDRPVVPKAGAASNAMAGNGPPWISGIAKIAATTDSPETVTSASALCT
nr:hypothetical protein [Halovulum marinum]